MLHIDQEAGLSMKIAGVLLIIAGVLALAYGGFTYTTHERALAMGPLQFERSKHHRVFIPPLLGASGILLGGALILSANSGANSRAR